ncbi:MAG: hypothetical protein IPI43_28850 [Sandaracinaceae bacterium]|nr:hypothetical protein [Sandaracinaceae bacterium]
MRAIRALNVCVEWCRECEALPVELEPDATSCLARGPAVDGVLPPVGQPATLIGSCDGLPALGLRDVGEELRGTAENRVGAKCEFAEGQSGEEGIGLEQRFERHHLERPRHLGSLDLTQEHLGRSQRGTL